MKQIVLILAGWMLANISLAQIPRMLQDAWYQELRASNRGLTFNAEEGEAAPVVMTDVIALMREAYNNKEWVKVDSLFEVAQEQAPDNANIYNWERTSLRRQMRDTENMMEMMHRLMSLYSLRENAGLAPDVPYKYGIASQWNETQRLVDYATYAGRRIDTGTQYEFLTNGLKGEERPLNAIVLCQLMDLSLADGRLSEAEYMARYNSLVSEAHATRDWLNDNFLLIDTKTVSDMLQALDQRERMMRSDSRLQQAINLADEADREERLKNSDNAEEHAQYYLLVAARHIANRQYNEAVEAIQSSIDLNKDNPVAYLRLAECYTANSKVTGRVGNFLDKYSSQFATVAAIDMLRENMRNVMSQQGRNAMTNQIDQLRSFINQHPVYRQDLFMMSMGYGDTVKLGSYIKRTITIREKY